MTDLSPSTFPSQTPSGLVVTIKHPAHPYYGQQVEVIRVRRTGPEPDLIIRLPDGSHAAIAADLTNYAGETENEVQLENSPPLLLDPDGLYQIAKLFDCLREQGRFPTQPSAPQI
jgi:hypothetical protein